MTKLVKHFSRVEWNVEIITVHEKYYNTSQIDISKLKDIARDINVIN